ncbi:MAG TPA: SAF domain-containing protein [Candidatus Dormibacteraeota bacterium]|jgi:Flp pilus assembly protein CpaB|nr:SAF domain-containing protein [Candidatus Dormibacteraeota bacterium]
MSNQQGPKPRSKVPQIALGALLVVVAFGGVILFGRGGGGSGGHQATMYQAARDIKTGAAVTVDDLSTVTVDVLPTGAIIDRAMAIGKIARQEIPANTRLIDSMLAAPPTLTAAKLYFTLPSGQVALNIPSSDISPYVQPGDQIDVIATVKPGTGTGATATTTQTNATLKGLKVISVGTPGTPTAGNLVVAVTLQQADLLEYIVKNTDFTYVLKSPLDAQAQDPGTQAVDSQVFKSQFGFR